jgi:hypothetical protein
MLILHKHVIQSYNINNDSQGNHGLLINSCLQKVTI